MQLRSLLNIVTPGGKKFTTLARVKEELKIEGRADDAVLNRKIEEASSDIKAALGYAVAAEDVIETFWHEYRHLLGAGYAYGAVGYGGGVNQIGTEELFLRRTPVTNVASVTLDDVIIDPAEYRLNGETGELYRLDSSGFPSTWVFCKSLIVAYTGGYVLPGDDDVNLPPAIEGAAIELVKQFWLSRTRDPLIKSEDLPGVRRVDYWVGTVGDPDLLPPEVLSRITPFRRPRMAVA